MTTSFVGLAKDLKSTHGGKGTNDQVCGCNVKGGRRIHTSNYLPKSELHLSVWRDNGKLLEVLHDM